MKYLEDPKKALKRKTKEGSKTLLHQLFLMKNTVALLGLYIELNETSADLQAAVQKAHGFKKANTLEKVMHFMEKEKMMQNERRKMKFKNRNAVL